MLTKRDHEDNTPYVITLGTRPEIIKFSPLIRKLEEKEINYILIHTGQHYSYEMDKIFFEELKLPEPDYKLNIGLKAKTHAEQTGLMLVEIEKILMKEKPKVMIVLGDTNTTLAGALAARKLNFIKIVHIEAGLRSYNWEMPEEINRIIVDHISDILLAPTKIAEQNLLNEGIHRDKIYVVGNIIVDSIKQNLEIAERKSKILKKLKLEKEKYFLLTIHRAENVDYKERLEDILKGIKLIKEKFPDYRIIFPIHPRTRKNIENFNLKSYIEDIELIEPVGYLDFLILEKNARLILTDSGGVQEEACVLRVPTVTIRTETERPETIEVGANIVSTRNPDNILKSVEIMLNRDRNWINPYGKNVTEKILDIIQDVR